MGKRVLQWSLSVVTLGVMISGLSAIARDEKAINPVSPPPICRLDGARCRYWYGPATGKERISDRPWKETRTGLDIELSTKEFQKFMDRPAYGRKLEKTDISIKIDGVKREYTLAEFKQRLGFK